ncbi:FT-interacting protein 1 [Heracleum sosnowskyi]|uniref:FT-interacting protein 1 n=1 Tax=Heracleum sosnowskyi TaxID=360622 RepID=A0AAD8HUE6_9APIA|nr:FT-interacting protein 1 [Heracleum sosnowskyi]
MQRHEDFLLKETKPHLGGAKATTDELTSNYDLVEKMEYLYVRVVEAKDLPLKDATGSYVEINLGNYKGITRRSEKKSDPEWSQVFAFLKDHVQATGLEATVKSKEAMKQDFVGRVLFDLNVVPPDTPLAPQWYRLEDEKGNTFKGELMLAVWWGTQSDKAFPDAWHSDSATPCGAEGLSSIGSKVYHSPKLWYLRINVIEAEGLMASNKTFVKAILGYQTLRTRVCTIESNNPWWNEDMMFVAAEPFEEPLILSVEDRVAHGKDEVLGRCAIPLQYVDRRLDHKPSNPKWYNLEKNVMITEGGKTEIKFARIHMRICFEGGYHVFDESTNNISDLRPTEEQLWKSSIGVLEVGILNARDLLPMKTKDGRATTDAYCVAKYGQKWFRTRTITDSFMPRWNEQYSWEVFDPCTVITVGVFDHWNYAGDKAGGGKDSRIGKVRIRLSTLETERVYTHSYPILVLDRSGVKKMGEIHLALRFTCYSLLNMIHMYSQPLLPKMHYNHPLSVNEIDSLKHQAVLIVSRRLSFVEPPLRKEVVEFMLDDDFHMWSLRKSKAILFRIMGVLSGLFALGKWFEEICHWKNPRTTILFHILFLTWVLYPVLILPTIFLYLFLIGVSLYRWRPKHPPHLDTRLSLAENVHPDELEEEFDTFPTSCSSEIVRMRYDRMRSIANRLLHVVGDLAIFGERLQSLLSWRDPRATALIVIFLLIASIVLYVAPFQVALLTVFYVLRHPKLRSKHPSLLLNFLMRLPAKKDCML